MNDYRTIRYEIHALKMLLLSVTVFSVVCSFNPQWHFWGVDYLITFPAWLRVMLAVVLAASMIPALARVLLKPGDAVGADPGRKYDTLTLLWISLLFAGFVLLSSNSHYLGDGYHLLERMKTIPSNSFEPLEHLLHQSILMVFGKSEETILLSYRGAAYFSGVLLLIGLRRFTSSRFDFLMTSVCLLGFGVVQFFFGYVERYSFGFVFLCLYLLSARHGLEEGKLHWYTPAFLVLAMGFHMACGALAPSVIYLVHQRYHSWKLTGPCLALLALAFAAAVFHAAEFRSLDKILLPLVPISDNPYAILTLPHIKDLLNVALLCHPLIFVVLPLLLLRRIAFSGLYLIALAGAMLFVVAVDPILTAIRDWDLLSLSAAPIFAAAVAILCSWRKADILSTRHLFWPLLIFAVIHSGSWVWQNSKHDESWDYFKTVVLNDRHLSVEYRKAGQFSNWLHTVRDVKADTAETLNILKKWEGVLTSPRHAEDVMDNRILLMKMYADIEEWERAISMVEGHEANLLIHPEPVRAAGYAFQQAGRIDKMEWLYEAFVNKGGRDPAVVFLLAKRKYEKGEYANAWNLFNLYFSIENTVSHKTRINFIYFSCELKHYAEAVTHLRLLRGKLGAPLDGVVEEAIAAFQREDFVRVDSLVSQLRSRAH